MHEGECGQAIVPATSQTVGAGEAVSPYEICYDPVAGIVRAVVRGFWSDVDEATYFATLTRQIEACRRAHGRAQVLVDRRGSPVQSPHITRRMQRANRELYRPEDRLALVVDGVLARMQVQRLITHGGTKAFSSHASALAWLKAQ